MRAYIVHYIKEVNDQCVDCEIEVESPDIFMVTNFFHLKIRVYKRITAIIEKPKG